MPAQLRPYSDFVKDVNTANVVITIYLKDKTLVATDPDEYNFKDGSLWFRLRETEYFYSNIPFEARIKNHP
ncbi:MAG: hypothetical protein AB7F43_14615 [Bacteriovoracia bacterium]